MQKHLKKLISLSLATLLAFTCYVSYKQVSADVTADGHFDVTNTTSGASSTDGWSYSSGVITISQSGDYTIEKACTCAEDYVHSSYSIVIGANITVNLTIEDVMIENTSGAAMDIDGTSKVTLILEGDNSFTSAEYYAGIQFNDATTGSLTITSDDDTNTLTATGGTNSAGIGSGYDSSTSSGYDANNITISGGTVTANGDYAAAGIGSAWGGAVDGITITGGIVYANGGANGAGIGTGSGYVLADNINITGGTIVATAGRYAAGIGGGHFCLAANITITGGDITATGGAYGGAGIGGGSTDSGGEEINITISNATITATGTNGGAGIGAGNYSSHSVTITITSGTIYASGGTRDGTGIGGGWSSSGDVTITIEGGTITAIGGAYGAAGIGNAAKSTGNTTITITGGNITAYSEGTVISPDVGHIYTAQAIGTSEYATGLVTITMGSTSYEPYYYDDNVEYTYLTDSGETVIISGNYVEFVVVPEVEESTTENSVIIVDTSAK